MALKNAAQIYSNYVAHRVYIYFDGSYTEALIFSWDDPIPNYAHSEVTSVNRRPKRPLPRPVGVRLILG